MTRLNSGYKGDSSMTLQPKLRVLVVEDDDAVRGTISTLLEAKGYDVSTAIDGFDALLHLPT